MKTEQTRFALLAKLREGKGRAKDEDASNKSLDVSGSTSPFMSVACSAATSIQPLGAFLFLKRSKLMLQKFIFCLSLILVFAVTSALADVFWIDRYGNISWEEERARLDNFAIQIHHEPDYVGYIYVNAGREACKNEAQKRAVRAKKYMVEVRGVPSDRVVWKDLGYDDEAEVVFYLFNRNKPIPYNPEYEAAKEGQVIKNCSVKTRKQKKRGKNNAAPNKSLDVRRKQRLC